MTHHRLTPLAVLVACASPGARPPPEVAPLAPMPARPVVRSVDGVEMVLVPAGPFYAGCPAGSRLCPPPDVAADEAVEAWRVASTASFWIDRLEISEHDYGRCMDAGACPPAAIDRGTGYPMSHATFESADAFCRWRGARLPTALEWEKAARGTDGRLYAWGNEAPTCDNVGLCGPKHPRDDLVDTRHGIGLYPAAASPYGALDMSGDVAEIVAERRGDGHFMVRGAPANTFRNATMLTTFWAEWVAPSHSALIGFRCAADAVDAAAP
jgi:formylglycine-generating enzyme required for sulfatase activity